MSSIRESHVYFTATTVKASWVLVPLLSLVGSNLEASAQVIGAGDNTHTVVEVVGDRINISGGQLSSDNSNLFQSFEQFNVSAEQTADFATGANVQNVIGRVSGGNASSIDGTLQVSGSDANLYLMNPAGVLMGPNAQLNLAGGFTATTATGIGFEEGQFKATENGDYSNLSGEPTTFNFEHEQAGAVVNLGNLNVKKDQAINLIGGTVVNAGSLSAPEGTVTMAAVEGGNVVRISQGKQLLSLEVNASTLNPENATAITPHSIGEMLTGSGLTNATALIADANGTVRLGSGGAAISERGGEAIASGTLSASGEMGGNINVLGNHVSLFNAHLNTSGNSGGGLIRIGGDYQGQGAITNASQTLVNENSLLLADALDSGNGGRIIVWANDTTQYSGQISARGGSLLGTGGFAEVSGKNHLMFAGTADMSALQGTLGTLLLDPQNWIITDGTAPPSDATNSYISSALLEDLSLVSNISLTADHNIRIENLSDNELRFQAGRSVTFNADADGNGIGEFTADFSDRITSQYGTINISGAGITVGDIATNTSASNAMGGNVNLTSSQGVIANNISTDRYSDRNNPGSGGNVTVIANGGDIDIRGIIKTWSYADGASHAGNGGEIVLRAEGSITTEFLNTLSRAGEHHAGQGGDITLASQTGNIFTGSINTQSIAGTNTSQRSGNVTLQASNGTVTSQDIQTSSMASRRQAGNGGNISILANEATVLGGLNSSSIAQNDAGNGGWVSIEADRIEVSDLYTQSQADRDEGNAGAVTLMANSSLVTKGILATGASHGEIWLTGDRIDNNLTNSGIGSIFGESVSFRPASLSRDINVGNTVDVANTLNISQADLGAITHASTIRIGREDGTGTVSLWPSIIASAGNRADIDILGGQTLRGPDLDTTFQLTQLATGSLLNAEVSFFNIENLVGGNQNDIFSLVGNGQITGSLEGSLGTNTLTYNGYNTAAEINLETRSATGLSAFNNIDNFIGSAGSDQIQGFSEDDFFTLTNDTSGTINSGTSNNTLTFSAIESLNGGSGNNSFNLEGLTTASGITIVGGSDLDNSQSNNRIVTNSANATWQLDGKNRGLLSQGNAALVAFSEIQHLDNTHTANGENVVLFTRASSQITGSVNSGRNNLSLIGDDINIGHSNNRDNRNAILSGSGRLTISPATNSIGIELGGLDTLSAQTLNITNGEIAAIQQGFIEILIGGENQTGDITFGGDANFKDSVVLRSQGNINTQGHRLLTTAGDLTLHSASAIRGGRLAALSGGVTLNAQQAISVDAVTASGGAGIALTSETSSVNVTDTLDSSSVSVNDMLDKIGGDISIRAASGVTVGDISTSGDQRSGNVTIRSTQSGITTGGITTANGSENSSTSSRSSGSVELSSPGSIEIEFIDARSNNNNNTTPTRINIETQDDFIAIGAVENNGIHLWNQPTSLSTRGSLAGDVRISYGSRDRIANLFQVGSSTKNGTALAIETPTTTLVEGDFLGSYTQENIELINSGIFSLPPSSSSRIPAAPTPLIRVERLNIPSVQQVIVPREEETGISFQQLETRNAQEFETYLGAAGKSTQIATIEDVRNALENIELETHVRPALVYVYFVPDAASEEAVGEHNSRTMRADDQLEIMLITQNDEPLRRRQWGVTRAQVDEANRTLREQATSQFSTAQQYLPPAQQLYNWIIKPIEDTLRQEGIASLGFVMDTGLRTLPVAVLHDGDHYLVESYSLGLLPSFSLADIDTTGTNRVNFNDTRVLAMGASEFENQPALPAVEAEVTLISAGQWEGDAFLNEDFVLKTLQDQLQKEDYGVLHLATHAVFESGNLENSYIQLWDEELSLDRINELELDQENIGLIILSACSTALGDYAAEYGFAGLAVGAGSQSALASLWPVSDEGTLGFMTQFYNQLKGASVRAEALRQTQIRMINEEIGIADGEVYGPNNQVIAHLAALEESGQWNFSHPFYWSAFTMIGNPW